MAKVHQIHRDVKKITNANSVSILSTDFPSWKPTWWFTAERSLLFVYSATTLAMKLVPLESMRTHSGERPYSCKQCDYSCTTASDLKKHWSLIQGEDHSHQPLHILVIHLASRLSLDFGSQIKELGIRYFWHHLLHNLGIFQASRPSPLCILGTSQFRPQDVLDEGIRYKVFLTPPSS